MGVRTCEVCGKRVLTSKAGYVESQGPGTVSPTGTLGVAWIAHNSCVERERDHARWNRLLDACHGDEEQARTVLGMIR